MKRLIDRKTEVLVSGLTSFAGAIVWPLEQEDCGPCSFKLHAA